MDGNHACLEILVLQFVCSFVYSIYYVVVLKYVGGC